MAKDKTQSQSMAESSMDAAAETPRTMRDALRNPLKHATVDAVADKPANDVAPVVHPGDGEGMAILERRIDNLENIIADIARVVEQQEIVLRDREDTLTTVTQSVAALRDRMDQWEKDRAREEAERAKETADLRAALAAAETRLKDLETQTTIAAPIPAAATQAVAQVLAEPPPVWSGNVAPPRLADLSPVTNAPVAAIKESQGPSYLEAARRAAIAGNTGTVKKSVATGQSARRFPRAQYVAIGCAAPLVVVAAATFVVNRHPAAAKPMSVAAAFKPAALAALPPPPPPELVIAPIADPAPGELASTPLDALREKAKTGDTTAARDVGLKYLAGDKVAVNEEEAARWLLSASYRGEPVAEYWLGTLYSRGQGVPADPSQANHWYGASAKQGNPHAMHRLGIASYEGLGMEHNPEEAARWFTQAAERGVADSQFDLAVLYERGTGVMQSLPDAYKWYAVAAAQGDKEAASRADVLSKSLKPAELAEAARAAAEFKPEAGDEKAPAASVAPKSSGD